MAPPAHGGDTPVPRRVHARGWVASADDVRIRYHEAGSGPVTLVFVHGWLCDSRYWRLQVPAFEQRYRVIAVDLAGHGESGFGRESWSIEAFAQDVAAVVRAADARPVVLVGHSLGGPVAIEAARLLGDRVAGVVAVDTLREDYFDPPPQSQRDRLLSSFAADFATTTREFVTSTMFVPASDPALRESITEDMVQGPPIVGLGALRGLLAYRPTAGLSHLEVPLVLINAATRQTDVARIAAVTPRFRFESIAGVGHFLMLEAPAEFNAALERAVQEIVAATDVPSPR